ISNGIARIAVPIFFMISGYLFYKDVTNGKLNEFALKFKKRWRSLVIPYFIWSLIGLLFYILLQSFPQSKPFFTQQLIRNFNLEDYFNTIVLYPIPYQLWFIRDLIVLVLLSPLIYLGLSKTRFLLIIIFTFAWIFDVDYILLTSESLLFFSLGAFLNIKKIELNISHKLVEVKFVFFLLWVLLTAFQAFLYLSNAENDILVRILHKMGLLFGIVTVWIFYDDLFDFDISKTKIYFCFEYTFFIFLCHEPLLTILKKLFYYLFGATEQSSFIIYIIAPILTILICITIAK